MKSVGEAMAIGRTFKESFQKALRSMEIGRHGFGSDGKDIDVSKISMEELREKIVVPSSFRIFYLKYAMQKGMTDKEINEITKIDPWFLHYMREIYDEEKALTALSVKTGRLTPEKAEVIKTELIQAKKDGFSDVQLAYIFGVTEDEFRAMRRELGIKPVYKMVDTCASEFKAYTPYLYSTYDSEMKIPCRKKKALFLAEATG